jgi:hypothetical protein
MANAHRIHNDLYHADKNIADPGDGKTITVREDLQICEMVSVAAETRTLANPTKSGVRVVLRMTTDGGDIVVTASNGFMVAPSTGFIRTKATFNDASDLLNLISVKVSVGVWRWQIMTRRIAYRA